MEEDIVRKLTRADRQKYHQFCDIKTREFLDLQRMNQCPTRDCSYRFMHVEPTGRLANFNCPGCKKTYCINCLAPHSKNLTCSQADRLKHLSPDEQASEAWKFANTRNCPGCFKPIQKNAGCIHMTCRTNTGGGCGHQFCWLCGADWWNHNRGTIIRNQGDFYGCANPHKWW